MIITVNYFHKFEKNSNKIFLILKLVFKNLDFL